MNDFWHGLNSKEKNEAVVPKKNRPNLDSIRIVHKQKYITPTPKQVIVTPKITKKKPKYALMAILAITIFIISIFLGSGYYIASAQKNKINIAKLIKNGKYLVLFQNNAEMRSSGGFIGSFATVEISDYKIKNIVFNSNIYKLDKAYSTAHNIIPPEPIQLYIDKWALRDSNYAASFPEAASQIQWFFSQETGETIDGVIAINASVAQDLLKMTGPIKLSNYNSAISSDNFFTTLTTEVEKNYFLSSNNRDENEPKSVLRDLMPVLVKKAMEQNKITLLKQLYLEMQTKQILLYSNNSSIENSILAENWGGEIQKTASDYLSISHYNVGANKSSLSVKESIDYKAINMPSGLVGNLILTRSHGGSLVWPDGININYSRILVPEGAVIISTTMNGKDITNKIKTNEEAGKTIFGLYFETKPGTSDVLNLSYNLPKTISNKNYTLLIQKQPGNQGDNLQAEFEGKILFDGVLNTDKYLSSQ